MAMHDVYVRVQFTDSAERTSERRYLLREQYDDVTPNIADIYTQAEALMTALNALSWDELPRYFVEIETITGGLSANVAANNQIVAFIRASDVTDVKGFIEVPAWDDGVYDQNSNNLLSTAFNVAAAAVLLETRNPETGENWALAPEYSQSRTRKSGVKLD